MPIENENEQDNEENEERVDPQFIERINRKCAVCICNLSFFSQIIF